MLTKEERILIGRRIVEGEITVHDAEKEYHFSFFCAVIRHNLLFVD